MNKHRLLAITLVASLTLTQWGVGCATGGTGNFEDDDTGPNSTGGAGGTSALGGQGGSGNSEQWPCGTDCSLIQTGECQQGTCDEETLNCTIVPADNGSACNDGLFCTLDDVCEGGSCVGGPQNNCDLEAPTCNQVVCNETSKTCSLELAADGQACTADDLCTVNAQCNNGLCVGQAKDCFLAPTPDACHEPVCNPANGNCEPVPGYFGQACDDPNDKCTVGKTCDTMGNCVGGAPMDCSAQTVGCFNGACDPLFGTCQQIPIAPGNNCAAGNAECLTGICDSGGNCIPTPDFEGQSCTDFNACTNDEVCTNGVCGGGQAVTACQDNDGCCPAACDETNDLDCASCDVNPADFPIAYNSTNSVGDMTFDDQCNLYWSGDGGEVFRLLKGSQQHTTLHDFNSATRGLVYNPNDNKLYASVVGKVYSMTKTGQNPTLLASGSGWNNGLEIAPAGWGSYGGQLVFSNNDGSVYTLPTSGGTITKIGSTTGYLSDLVFDGQNLYVVAYAAKKVFQVSPTGVFTLVTAMSCSPDGIAVKENSELYVACGSSGELYKIGLPNGSPVLIGSPTLSGGWAPVGMIFDGLNDIVIMENGEALKTYTP